MLYCPREFTEFCPQRMMVEREEADILNTFPTSGWNLTFWSHLKQWESFLYTAYTWAIECKVQTRKCSCQDLNFNFPAVWACTIFLSILLHHTNAEAHKLWPLGHIWHVPDTHSKSLIPIVYLFLYQKRKTSSYSGECLAHSLKFADSVSLPCGMGWSHSVFKAHEISSQSR